MSDTQPFDFGKFIPGFDFLQQLAVAGQGAASPVPGLGSWVAPTVSVEELDKRIQELRAVQFWLDQNATALKATIQALEVQKMTLSALAGMNLSMAEVTKAFTLPTAAPAVAPMPPVAPMPAGPTAQGWPYDVAASAAEAAPAPAEPAQEPQAAPAADPAPAPAPAGPARSPAAGAAPAPGMADPLQWWGALTQQFQQIANQAMREAARAAPPQGVAASTDVPAAAPKAARKSAAKTARKPGARKTTAKKATAKKSAAKKAAGDSPADTGAKSDADWPLPPPFKFGR